MTQPEEPWTIGRLLNWTTEYLGKHGTETPRLDAEVLLAHARGCQRIDLYVLFGETAPEETRTAFRDLVRRRAAGTPVAYLVGHREFYSLDFEVTPDVLIPRPETEHLVLALLDHVQGKGGASRGVPSDGEAISDSAAPNSEPPSVTIADIGTGSGILAICAAKYIPYAHATAIDISPAALAVARRNADRHGVANRIQFIESDLFGNLPHGDQFDCIVSNPPYISTSEMAQLANDVRNHEPHVALAAGDRGTEVIERLIAQASTRLKPNGILFIEVSPSIAADVERLIADNSSLTLGPTIRDLAGHLRIIQAAR